MKLGTVGAIVGGILGAVVWALVARFLHIELGYLAWGIGFAVGAGSAMIGGSGNFNGLLCAMICLLSIFAGKVMAVHWSLTPEALAEEFRKKPELTGASEADIDAAVKFAQSVWTWNDSIEAAKSDLGPMDLLFAGLGVFTAFSLGRQGGRNEPVPAPVPAGGYDPIPTRVPPEDSGPQEPK